MKKLILKAGMLVTATVLMSPVDVFAGAWLDQYLNPSRQNLESPKGKVSQQPASTPEIDAASGTTAIALLTAAVLLMRERARSRRS